MTSPESTLAFITKLGRTELFNESQSKYKFYSSSFANFKQLLFYYYIENSAVATIKEIKGYEVKGKRQFPPSKGIPTHLNKSLQFSVDREIEISSLIIRPEDKF